MTKRVRFGNKIHEDHMLNKENEEI